MSKVLLVDDEKDLLDMMVNAFKMDGYEIITAMQGDEAYTKALETKPDLVVSDILMPHTSGLDLCKKLKGNALFTDTPVILVTALYKGTEYEQMAKSYGADAVLNKPYDIGELLQVARTLLATGKTIDAKPDSEDKGYPLDVGDA